MRRIHQERRIRVDPKAGRSNVAQNAVHRRRVGPNVDPFMLHIYAALAEKERSMGSERTKAGLMAAKARGVKLGGLNAKGIANREGARARAEALRPVFAELSSLSANAIAIELNQRGVPTPTDSPWSAVTVIRVQRRLEAVS